MQCRQRVGIELMLYSCLTSATEGWVVNTRAPTSTDQVARWTPGLVWTVVEKSLVPSPLSGVVSPLIYRQFPTYVRFPFCKPVCNIISMWSEFDALTAKYIHQTPGSPNLGCSDPRMAVSVLDRK